MKYQHDNNKLRYMILRDVGLTDTEARIYTDNTINRLSVSEIAEKRDTSPRNVSNHLHNARRKLSYAEQKVCMTCEHFRVCGDASISNNHQAHICLNYRKSESI
jgi:radical SAM protein with 4Fe4S-binding SPASM domain